jgi:hypothetical protein
MKTIIKRITIQLYCRDLIAGMTVARLFRQFNLSEA